MSDRKRVLLGIDIGGTKTVVAVGHPSGEVLLQERLEHWSSGHWRADLEMLAAHARAILGRAGIERPDAVGVCAPGPLDPVRGIVLQAPNVAGWVDVPVVEQLGATLGAPVRLENDANAAALAEWRWGAGRGTRHMIFLTMSTGIGGGLILDGRLYRGAHFLAGEIGHVPIRRDGRRHAGLAGTLEGYAGGVALAERIREAIATGQGARILALAGGDPEQISAETWVAAIREGDAWAQRLQQEFVEDVAQVMAGLVMMLDPEMIALGTIVQRNPDLFLPALRARVFERIWPVQRDVRIVAGALGEQLPAYAALSVGVLELEEPAR